LYAFHEDVWAFVCMVESMSMDTIEISVSSSCSIL
jgi:hypothetical protein